MKLKTNAKINNDMRTLFLLTTLLFIIPNMFGQKEYRLNSPDGKLEVTLYIGDRITYELTEEGHTLIMGQSGVTAPILRESVIARQMR